MTNQQRIAVTGATGRLGRLLRMVWAAAPPAGLVPLWIGRSGGSGPDEICADLMADLPDLPKGCILLHLAGSVAPGRPPSDHAALARAAVALADRAEARHLFRASTAAVSGIDASPARRGIDGMRQEAAEHRQSLAARQGRQVPPRAAAS